MRDIFILRIALSIFDIFVMIPFTHTYDLMNTVLHWTRTKQTNNIEEMMVRTSLFCRAQKQKSGGQNAPKLVTSSGTSTRGFTVQNDDGNPR